MRSLRRYLPLFSVLLIGAASLAEGLGYISLSAALKTLNGLLPEHPDAVMISTSTLALLGAIFKLIKSVKEAWRAADE